MGGPSTPTNTTSTVTQSNIPEYAAPYYKEILTRASQQSNAPYEGFGGQRIAEFSPDQQATQQATMAMQTPGQIGYGSDLAAAGGLGALQAGQYQPGQFSSQQVGLPNLTNYQMAPAENVSGGQYETPTMATAQTGYQPTLQDYQMNAPQQFGQAQAQQYMSPYMQSVVDVQKREAVTDAQKGQLMQNLGAARQGTYGGARQLLAGTERERALGQQMGDIQSKGLQSAYENAQAQFERDRAAGYQTSAANQQASLGVQKLGADIGTQTALANLSAEQQANVQNQAAQLQTQGLNAEQALKAALANQQAGLTVGQQNLQAQLGVQDLGTKSGLQALLANQQADIDTQKMAEQSRQFGSQQGLAGAAGAIDASRALGSLGVQQQNADMARLSAQAGVGEQQRQQEQAYLDQQYADFLRQRDYPMEQLGQYSNLLRGIPVGLNSTATTYAQSPSALSQVAGAGLGAASIYKMAT